MFKSRQDDKVSNLVIRNVQRWQHLQSGLSPPHSCSKQMWTGVALNWSRIRYRIMLSLLALCCEVLRKLSSEKWSQWAQEMALWQSNVLKLIHIGISDDSSVISAYYKLCVYLRYSSPSSARLSTGIYNYSQWTALAGLQEWSSHIQPTSPPALISNLSNLST